MKEFNGTIVIVDPEKFAKETDLGNKIDINLTRISPNLGFRNMFFTETGIGNCFLTFYRVDEPKEYYQKGHEVYLQETIIKAFAGNIKPQAGQISVDSGSVGVFYLEDIEKYNPGALKGLKPWVDYIVLRNFRGRVGYIRDQYGVIHFYGDGTCNFYTL